MSYMYTAEVVADSISPEGHRITSVKAIYPHAVHKDMLRHRCMNRNVESMRAKPPEKLIEALRNGAAFKPDVFAKRTKGMGQGQEIITTDAIKATFAWNVHVQQVCDLAEQFLKMDIAKQQVNFLLQDLCPLTEIITATDWSNFAALRTELNDDGSPVARPEVYKTAHAIMEAIEGSTPQKLEHDWLHLPCVTDREYEHIYAVIENSNSAGIADTERHWIYVSAGRCARISYGDYQWWKEDHVDSVNRAHRLLQNGHMSPFEQQAKPFSTARWSWIRFIQERLFSFDTSDISSIEREEIRRQLEYSGNLHGWVPARKSFPYEWDYGLAKDAMLWA